MSNLKEKYYSLKLARERFKRRDKDNNEDFQYYCKLFGANEDGAREYIFDYLYNGGNIKQLRKDLARFNKDCGL